MKITKILIVLLLVGLTIGAVSAADNQTSDNLTFSEDSPLESSTEDITLTQNENNDNLTATPGTLTELREEIDAAAGSELKLTRDYEYSGSEYINVSVNYAMTIDGQGHTIDCKKARNLFLVYDDNVVLKNIKFANCKSDGFDGSAIQWYGNAGILENCSFENCTSTMEASENSPNAGAIYWYGNNGRISNCSFEKCSAMASGGAIYWRGINGSATNCSFVKCSIESSPMTMGLVSYEGGAIYWKGINGSMINCSFKDCSAEYGPGDAIYWNGDNGSVSDCEFVKFSSSECGTVYWNGNNGDLTNCSFVNCSIPLSFDGGVLYWLGINGSIADCGFDSLAGSAIDLSGANGKICGCDFKNLTQSNIRVKGVNGSVINCSFENCSTYDSASAIDWRSINGSLINCSFINCSSNNHGGAVRWASEGGFIGNSTFKKCSAFTTYGDGGAIILAGSNSNVSGCNFEECHADIEGGAIYVTGTNCNVSKCNFEGCHADNQGGAIHWEGSNGTVSNCSFENCSAGSTTGAIIWLNGNSRGQIEYSNFTNCYAPNTKAIYASNEKLGIYSCIFEDNTTNDLNDLVSASNITQCILNGNPIKKDLVMNLTASDIIYGENAIVIVSLPADATGNVPLSLANSNSEIIMNKTGFPVDGIINYNFPNLTAGTYIVTATYSGDENYYPANRTANFKVNKKPSVLTIATIFDEYLTILVNLTAGYGIVTINIENESFYYINVTNGTGVLNVANMTPGSYYFTAEFLGNDNYEAASVDTILTINATDTFKNLQDLIDAAGDELNLTSNFTYADGDTSVTINKPITINGNGYTINAKTIVGLKIKSDNVNLINITFLNGYNSMEHGGAIIWEGNGGSITNCSFTGCGCDGYGAAVSWQGANGLVSNCSFTDCNALSSGGSIHWSGANGRISNCEFTNSRSGYQGGAIFWQASDGRIEDSVFTTFKSTSQGNAIYITNNDVVVSGCDFEDARYDSIDTVVYGGQLLGYTLNGIRHKNVDLEISLLTNANGTLEIGDPFNINVTVHNSGSDDATGAYVSLSLPSSIVVTSANTLTGEYSYNGTIWDIGNLGADQTATLTLTAYAIQSGNITITSTAYALESDANPSNNMDQIQITVANNDIDLEINLITDITGTCKTEDPFNIIITVHNSGLADATGAYVSLMLPPSIVVTSANTLTGSYSNNGSIWDIGNLDAGDTATLAIAAYAIQSGNVTITSTVDASQSDANPTSNTDEIQITVLDANTFEYLNLLIEAAGDTLILTDDYYGTGNQIEISKSITIDGNGHTLDANNKSRIFKINADGVTLTNIVFKNGNVGEYGGAIEWLGANGILTHSSFINCSAIYNGGTITWNFGNGTTTHSNSTNSPENDGTSLWGGNGTTTNPNSTGGYGGSFPWGGINGTVIISNISSISYGGGAIYWNGIGGAISDCIFTVCSSQYGGGIYVETDNTSITGCDFERCSAEIGGAIYWNGATGNCLDSNFTNCTAESEASAIYWNGTDGKIESSTFVIDDNDNSHAVCGPETLKVSNSKFKASRGKTMKEAVLGATIENCKVIGESRTNPEMTVHAGDITCGEKLIVNVMLPEDTEDILDIKVFKAGRLVDSASVLPGESGGNVLSEFSNLKIGEYTLNVEYRGDGKYENASHNMAFTVRPKVVVPQIVPESTNANIYIDFGEDITDTIIIKIDKRTFDVLNINKGIVNATTKPLDYSIGTHTLTLAYEGDEFDDSLLEYNGKPIEYNIEIVPVEIPIEEEIQTTTEGTFTIEIPLNAKGTITLLVDGEEAQTFDAEKIVEEFLNQTQGTTTHITMCILNIDLSKYGGKHTITFKYSGDENYHAFTKEANVTVRLANPSITATPTTALYTADATYTIKVYKDTGILAARETVIVKMNGKAFKTLTTTNGIATFKITQTPGPYTLTITSLGKTIQKTLTVKHLVTLKTVSVKRSAKKLVLTATLAKVNGKYLKNKKITFKFNGKKYTAKTNKKGIAKVTVKASALKKLKAGKKITYQATYLKDTVKKTAKVKK